MTSIIRCGCEPVDIGVDPHQPRSEDLAALIPGATRGGRAVVLNAETLTAAYGLLRLIAVLTRVGP
ncbi:hypothetical protein ACQP10_22435 [Streptosporangium sandarakinum]|uniref:hypothetical protein n=1 Tax=Streptosporangium sandarakinum TaxID=1260955 RepID=UPI003D8E836A